MLDIAASDIEVYSVTEDHFLTAGRPIGRHSLSHRLRTLDALQLAVALDLSTQHLLDRFVVAEPGARRRSGGGGTSRGESRNAVTRSQSPGGRERLVHAFLTAVKCKLLALLILFLSSCTSLIAENLFLRWS